jgi:methionyl aminopeptidase
MARVGRVVGMALRAMREGLRPGMTTAEVEAIGAGVFAAHGARSAPRLVYGFPGTVLISVNDEAVHGIPGDRVLAGGDLVKLDVTAELDGYVADAAETVPLPPVSPQGRRLAECARSAFERALDTLRPGAAVREIGRAVETRVRRCGFRVIRELASHGVGRTIHEWPSVPNYYDPRTPGRLSNGLVLTVEPIIAAGSGEVVLDPDGWTVRTADGSLAAHYEHTVVITRGRPVLLTALSEG